MASVVPRWVRGEAPAPGWPGGMGARAGSARARCGGLEMVARSSILPVMDPGPPSTPEAVLSAIRASLEEAARALDDPLSLEGALVRFSSVAARLSTFELEFGVAPTQLPG